MGNGKGGKASGKCGKGCMKGGDGKGSAGKRGKCGKGGYPPKAIWKTLNPDPALIRNAQWMRWHGYPQRLSAAWGQPAASDWDGPAWLTVPGARLASLTTSRVPKNPAPTAFIKNQFEALSEEGSVDDSELPHGSSCGCSEACGGMKVSLADAVKMPSRNKLKAARRMKAFEESEKENMKPTLKEKKSAVMDDQVKSAVMRPRPLPCIVVADLN